MVTKEQRIVNRLTEKNYSLGNMQSEDIVLNNHSGINNALNEQVVAFGGIHVHDNNTAQSVPTGTTYTKITQFDNNNNCYRNVTQDVSNNQLKIKRKGCYLINATFNFESGTPNVIWRIAPFVNGVEIDQIHIYRKTSSAGDAGSATMTGHYDFNVGDVIDCRVRHDNGSAVNFTTEYANFNITYVGGSE